ncbi:response regulator [Sulfuriferula thiophila]|uniref:response regulator n=1 Tax=Sulfuriferula thiophila TaxID=1781211 RepID=UPI000F60932C|nr:response regulator [Sulfuriferula thiophila]
MITADDIFNARILIVDDQHANVLLLEQMLSEAGYLSISSTMDPFAVCDLHRAHHYDLILLDLQMPGMDGFEVMEGLQKIDINGYVPVLVITAQPGHKLRALSSGAKDFVAKPFELIEVKTRIHNMLEVRLLYKQLQQFNQALEQTVTLRTAELRDSEAHFRRLSELASDWFWEQDEDGYFTKIHGPVQELLGAPIDDDFLEVISGAQLVHWDKAERAALNANITARRPFLDLICSRIGVNGAHQYFQVSGEPMFDATGRFEGYRGVGRDVTDIMLVTAHHAA